MDPHWLITHIIAALILPPMGLILLACGGWLLSSRGWYLGRLLMALSVALLIALSTEAVAYWLARPLEQQAIPTNISEKPQAIVILGGGRMRTMPSNISAEADASDEVSPMTLMRLRRGAALHRQTGLPILVTGGKPDRPGESEGRLMERCLKQDFGVPVRWVDEQAANTAENALFSARLLRSQSINRVWLVTDAVHLPRAQLAFSHTGLEVTPAPSTFIASAPLSAASFIPTAPALRLSYRALHEWLGLLWYRISLGAAM